MTVYFDDGFDMNSSMTRLMEKAAAKCIELEAENSLLEDWENRSLGKVLDSERCTVSVSFAMKDEIQRLNKNYRGIDKVTDVLSFPQFDSPDSIPEEGDILLGDVVICVEVALEQSREYGHSQERELLYLFTHSILHLLGYDHMEEEEKKMMRKREEEVMEAIGLGMEGTNER